MFSFPDTFSNSSKAGLEAQFAMYTALTNKAFEGLEKLIYLNLGLIKTSMEESTLTTKRLLDIKDPQEFINSANTQPDAEKALTYGRSLFSIATTTQAELTKAAENQFTEANRKILALVEALAKNAPPGSENFVESIKSSVGNLNAGYEQLSKTAKQSLEAVESNINASIKQFSQVAEKATPRALKK